MKIKIVNISCVIFIILSIALLLLLNQSPVVGICLSMLIFIINIFWITNHEAIFFNFIISTLAWGATLNLKYRINNIMLSDITLMMLIISMFISKYKNRQSFIFLKYREVLFIIGYIIFSFMIGIVSRYKFYNIFQDLKLAIYLLIPYIYLINKPYKNNKNFYLRLLKVICICTIIISLQEVIHFIRIGPINMINGNFGNRDVSIQVQIVTIMSVIMIFANEKTKIFSKMGLIIFEIMCFISCLLSFTRTIWITYIISMLICIILNTGIKSFIKKVIVISVILISISFIVINTNNDFIMDTINAFIRRMESIVYSLINTKDTLAARVSDSYMIIEEKINTFSLLWGKGLGDSFYHYKRDNYLTFNENSILYYSWKYGVVFSFAILIYLIKIIKKTLDSKNIIIIASSLAICIYLFIGNFSGNLNGYYLAPILSIYFAYPKIYSN